MNEEILMKYISMEIWFLITTILFTTTFIMIAIRSYYFLIIALIATITAGKLAFDRKREVEND